MKEKFIMNIKQYIKLYISKNSPMCIAMKLQIRIKFNEIVCYL